MSRPSYRSILALYLFSLAEAPCNNEDPGFSQLCMQVFLTQLGIVRSPSRNTKERRPGTNIHDEAGLIETCESQVLPQDNEMQRSLDCIHRMRDAVFWMGVGCDTRLSLISQTPMVILRKSVESKLWDFILQRTVIFDQSFRYLRTSLGPIPSEVVVVILEHATAYKTMCLSTINQFCDALLQGDTDSMTALAQRISCQNLQFREVFDQLLAICGRDYLTLGPESQLNYGTIMCTSSSNAHLTMTIVLLNVHYHLGTLVLADVLKVAPIVPKPLADLALSPLHACHAIVKALNLALTCDRYCRDDSPFGNRILLDPNPSHMVEVLSRCGKAILHCHQQGEISSHNTQHMFSVVCNSLEILCQVSHAASTALSSIRSIASATRVGIGNENCRDTAAAQREVLPSGSFYDEGSISRFLQEL